MLSSLFPCVLSFELHSVAEMEPPTSLELERIECPGADWQLMMAMACPSCHRWVYSILAFTSFLQSSFARCRLTHESSLTGDRHASEFQPSVNRACRIVEGNNQIGRFSYSHFDHALVFSSTSGSPAQVSPLLTYDVWLSVAGRSRTDRRGGRNPSGLLIRREIAHLDRVSNQSLSTWLLCCASPLPEWISLRTPVHFNHAPRVHRISSRRRREPYPSRLLLSVDLVQSTDNFFHQSNLNVVGSCHHRRALRLPLESTRARSANPFPKSEFRSFRGRVVCPICCNDVVRDRR